MSVEAIVIAVGLGVNLLTVVGVAMKLSARFTKVEVLCNHVIKNHIPHIYSEISELRELIITHITKQDPSS
jgi:hypothetical protein